MTRNFSLSMKAWVAVFFVVTLLVWYVIVESDWKFATNEQRWSAVISALVVFVSSALAAYDSSRIHLRRYQSSISHGPIGLFLVCALLFWPFGLIWYLVVRIRISLGKMPLKQPLPVESMTSPSGLVQPWRSRRH